MLVGQQIWVAVSEPWELAQEPDEAPRLARVVEEQEAAENGSDWLIVRFEPPLFHQTRSFVSAVARPRHREPFITSLMKGKSCEANLVALPPDASARQAIKAGWINGGLGIIARLGVTDERGQS